MEKQYCSPKKNSDKRVDEDEHSGCKIGVEHKKHKVHFSVDSVNLGRFFRCTQVSHTACERTEQFYDDILHIDDDHPVVGINAHRRQANERGHEQAVGIVHDDRCQLVHTHSTNIFQDAVPFFLFRQFMTFLQIRKFIIRPVGNHNVGQQLHHLLNHQIQDKIARQQQHRCLQNRF